METLASKVLNLIEQLSTLTDKIKNYLEIDSKDTTYDNILKMLETSKSNVFRNIGSYVLDKENIHYKCPKSGVLFKLADDGKTVCLTATTNPEDEKLAFKKGDKLDLKGYLDNLK